MEHAVSIDRSAIWATRNERVEALKGRNLPTPDNQQPSEDGDLDKIMDPHLYKATKEGDVENFIDALEKVSESRKLALSLIFDQVSPSRNSLLHVAASSGKDDVMELILNHFPDLMTRKNSSEDTPLHIAVQDRRLEATNMLICRMRDSEIIYQKNKDNKSPLYLALENCSFRGREDRKRPGWEILQLLLQEYARDEAYAVKIQGKSPILAAVKWGWGKDSLEETMKRLPKLLHVRDENGGTPLHSAASVDNAESVEFLLRECPYLAHQTDENGSYPIHIACECGNFLTLRKLVGTWPNLAEIKNKKGQNILHVAAKAGNDYEVQYILKKSKWLANAKDVDGNTPLHLASMHNHCEVMRSLTKVKIKRHLWLRNNDELTALDVAMESRFLSTKYPAFLGRAILIAAGVERSQGRDVPSPRGQRSVPNKKRRKKKRRSGASKSSPAEWIKDQVNTLLLVATLVASVTFTAGITMPGGYNASSDPHPGSATMLHNGVFQLFVISNSLAMYSSILAVVVLLWGLSRDFYIAELAYRSAGPLLLMALTGMTVAFFEAVTVAVSKLTWLGRLVLSIGVLYLAVVVVVLAALVFPSSKSAMRIVSLYYLAVALCVSAVRESVKFCVKVFRVIMLLCVRILDRREMEDMFY